MNESTYVEGFHNKNEVKKMTYSKLGNTDMRVSRFLLGCGPLGGLYESIDESEGSRMVKEAIQSGVNYIDTAPFYGQGRSERIIGKALKEIPRQSYYIATKVGRYTWDIHDQFDFSAKKTRESIEKSLKLLGLDYVDIIQVHDIEYAQDLDQILNETLPTLQQIVKEGKARYIGITSYVVSCLKEVIERSKVKIDCVLSYARFTLFDDELLHYLPFFKENGVGVINAGSLALGLLTENGPSSWHVTTDEIRQACKKASDYCNERNIDFGRLAIVYCNSEEQINNQLIGIGKLEYLKQNLEHVLEKPTETDRKHIEEIKKKFFSNLSSKNWEYNDLLFAQLKEFRQQNK